MADFPVICIHAMSSDAQYHAPLDTGGMETTTELTRLGLKAGCAGTFVYHDIITYFFDKQMMKVANFGTETKPFRTMQKAFFLLN